MPKRRFMFHTQGYDIPYLKKPILCSKDNAWLGHGFYYWLEEGDAIYWGQTAKRNYKKFGVYVSDIDCENILDTVFNEEHYIFWIRSIDKAVKNLYKTTNKKPTIECVNAYLMQKGGWDKSITGIMFQDLPVNDKILKVAGFYYRKRIQLAIFNNKIIINFIHNFDGEC